MKRMIHAACAIGFSLLLGTAAAQAPVISFQSQSLSGLSAPVDIISANDGSDRMFIVQQGGIVRLWNRATGVAPGVFMNIGPSGLNLIASGGEQGLLSMAFHPDYDGTTNRYFFLYFTNTGGNVEVARFETTSGDPNTVNTSSYLSLLIIPHPGQTNHNGGKLNFGPDGYLYFATGDGGGGNDPSNNAQNGNSLLGKMMRIDINGTSSYGAYSVPPANPFVGSSTVDPRIYALGLRNPFRWSFDRANGNMWIGDVGQSAREEIDFRPAGSTAGINYGWRCYEGTIPTPGVTACTPPGAIPPIYEYINPTQGRAVTGGYVYRGAQFPAFRGYYIAADYVSANIFILWPNGSGGWNSSVQAGSQNIAGFGEAEDGTLYAVGNDAVFRIVATGGTVLPVRMLSFTVRKLSGQNELKWTTGYEENTARFHIEYSFDGRVFSRAGAVAAGRGLSGGSYSYLHTSSLAGGIYYRLAIEAEDGSIQYSSILHVLGDKDNGKIYPTLIRDNNLILSTPVAASLLQLINGAGSIVFEKRLTNSPGALTITLPSLPKGVYIVKVVMKDDVLMEKIILE